MTNEEVKKLFVERREKIVKGINLVVGVRIRLISKEDLEDLKTFPPIPPDVRGRISPRMFVLEKRFTVKNRHDFEASKTMQNIVLALRLLKGGYIYGGYVFYICLSKKRRLVSWSCEEAHPRGGRGVYALNFDEIPALVKNIKRIQSVDFSKRKSLYLACKRFQRVYEKEDAEDRLIDLVIAFEELFVRKEIPGNSFKEKIANGCSDLLGKNDKERQEIKRLLAKAYSIRSHIVHSAEYRKEHDMYEFVSKIEDYLRESIKKLLD
jgi:hypothetical protein